MIYIVLRLESPLTILRITRMSMSNINAIISNGSIIYKLVIAPDLVERL